MVVEKVFAVIAESTRRDILEALAQESKAVGQLVDELGVSQPTVSKHLRVLREAGVVTMRAQGQKRFYGINTEPLALVSTWLDSLGAGLAQSAVEKQGFAPKETTAREAAAVNGSAAGSLTADGSAGGSAAAKAPVAGGRLESAAGKSGARVPAAAAETTRATVQAAPTPAVVPASAPVSGPSPVAVRATGSTPAPAVPPAAAKAVVPVQGVPGAAAARELSIIGNDSAGSHDGGVPGQIGRSVGRAANKAADLLANLPTFRRRKD